MGGGNTWKPRRVGLRGGLSAVVRPLARTDGERLAAFYATLRPEDERFYCPHPLTREEAMKKAARADDSTFVCAVLTLADESFAGYAWFQWSEGAACSTVGICVSPPYQGQGAGRALLASLTEIAAMVGPETMSLTVQKSNPAALSLYSRMGFRIVRDQVRAGDGEPEYYMERDARPPAGSEAPL